MSKEKGSRLEREVASDLNSWFNTTEFHRTPMSGAFVGGSNSVRTTNKRSIDTLSGDITTPSAFRFSIECKNYSNKNGPNPWRILSGEDSMLHKWLDQTIVAAERTNRDPLLIFRITPKCGTWFVLDPTRLNFPGIYTTRTLFHYRNRTFLLAEYKYLKDIILLNANNQITKTT